MWVSNARILLRPALRDYGGQVAQIRYLIHFINNPLNIPFHYDILKTEMVTSGGLDPQKF